MREYDYYLKRTQKALLKDSDVFAVKLNDIDRARLALICDVERKTITDAIKFGLQLAAEQAARDAR